MSQLDLIKQWFDQNPGKEVTPNELADALGWHWPTGSPRADRCYPLLALLVQEKYITKYKDDNWRTSYRRVI